MATTVNATLKHKRGTEASMPILKDGQIYLCSDNHKVYKGTSTGENILISDIASLNDCVKKSNVNIIYYVNASTGNNNNDGLTSSTPFKTIQQAINMLPQALNHSAIINVASGTYNENIIIQGFFGKGSIQLLGANTQTNTHFIIDCTITNNAIPTSIQGFNITTPNNIAININSCIRAEIVSCVIGGQNTNLNGIQVQESNAFIKDCYVANRLAGIYCNIAMVLSLDNQGDGNTYGLLCQGGGIIGKNGTQPSGTTNELAIEGGVIR